MVTFSQCFLIHQTAQMHENMGKDNSRIYRIKNCIGKFLTAPSTFNRHSSSRTKVGYRNFNSPFIGRAIIVYPAAHRSSSRASAYPPRRGIDLQRAKPYNGRNFRDSGYIILLAKRCCTACRFRYSLRALTILSCTALLASSSLLDNVFSITANIRE